MKCSTCDRDNPEAAQFCVGCGTRLTASKSSRPNFFSVLAISVGSILSISVVGGIIGTIVGVIYVSSSSDFQDDGSGLAYFFAFLIVLVFLGGGALLGAILGVIVGIVISLKSIPNKTKGDYFRVIGAPLLVILVATLLIFFQTDGVSLVTDAINQNREDAKLDKELEAAVEIVRTYAQNECEYIKTILVEDQYPVSQDRLVSLVSRAYQLFKPIEITHSWDNGDAAPPAGQEASWGRWGVLMRYTATDARGPFYDMTETQSMWDSILPNIIHDTLHLSPAQWTEDRANWSLHTQYAMDGTLLSGYHHKILSLAGIWDVPQSALLSRGSYQAEEEKVQWPDLDFMFFVQENGLVISNAGLCYQNKEDFSDIILDTLLDHSVASPK